MVSIGRWVVFTACQQARRWSRGDDLFVTVNMTATEFLDSHMVESVSRAVSRAGLRAAQLKIEITETESMTDPCAAIERITELERLGVDVLIDDFGTGQSSLSYLRSFPARILKLDRAFAADLDDPQAGHDFLSHVIAAMKSLSKIVLLEGVATADEARDAVRLKFDMLQGYHFGAAIPADEFELYLTSRRP